MENQALLPYRSSENRKIAESGLNKPKRDYGLFKFLALSYVVIHSSIWYFLSDSTLRISPDGRKEGVQHSRERIWRFTDVRRAYFRSHDLRSGSWNSYANSSGFFPTRLNLKGTWTGNRVEDHLFAQGCLWAFWFTHHVTRKEYLNVILGTTRLLTARWNRGCDCAYQAPGPNWIGIIQSIHINEPRWLIAHYQIKQRYHAKCSPPFCLLLGGPGGSGVSLVETAGQSLQVVLGLQYSIIGFDPRGVNNTTPGFDCFQTNPIARDIFLDRSLRSICNTSSADIGEHFVSGLALGKQCAFMENDGSSAGPHMNTPVVARDMLSIVHAEQREHGLKAEDGKLWYWGFSYGMLLYLEK